MVRAVSAGGDTDTNAAMAGALSGALNGVGAIPPRWLEGLRGGDRGRDYIADISRMLWGLLVGLEFCQIQSMALM